MYFHFRKTPKGLYIPQKGSDRVTVEKEKEEWRGFICYDCGYKSYVAVDEYWNFRDMHDKECPAKRREKIVIP